MSLRDPYLSKIDQFWDEILGMAELFTHIDPIIQFNVTTNKIKAYASKDYLGHLSDRTRESAKKQFKDAKANGKFMMFVLDEVNRVHRSFIFDLENEE